VDSIDAPALELLMGYPFPGNVRELENLLEGISITLPTDRAAIRVEDVRTWLRHRRQPISSSLPGELPLRLHDLELWAISEALNRSHGNKRRAAELLGISRDTLYRKLHELGVAVGASDRRT
jgi:transcriptional regulator with PAS, ATPase and Fis domain